MNPYRHLARLHRKHASMAHPIAVVAAITLLVRPDLAMFVAGMTLLAIALIWQGIRWRRAWKRPGQQLKANTPALPEPRTSYRRRAASRFKADRYFPF